MLLVTPLFLYANSQQKTIVEKAISLKLYDSHVWKNLLHVKGNKPSINHPSFLCSFPKFSLKNELKMTIESFFNTKVKDDKSTICKYPARYVWLKDQLSLTDRDFPTVNCKSFNQYLEKTGAENLKLVFVSENTTSPSSMMGHIFFKLSGIDKKNIKREHAVSFFTVIDTLNIPSLLVQSTITGMKGFFLLRPYKEQVDRYLKEENRNIWEYTLNLSKGEKQLIYFHFWELKDVKIKYLFTGFNCATIVHDMLSMGSIKLENNYHLWITPKDVIKDAKKNKIIKNVSLKASNKWQIKMLLDELKESKNTMFLNNSYYHDIKSFNNLKYSHDIKTMYLEKELLLSYTEYMYHNNEINSTVFDNIHKIIEIKKTNVKNDYMLDLIKYKNPLNTFNDTQASLAYVYKNNKKYLGLSFLPASNTLFDDNREYFGESDLKIMAFNILANKYKIKLDSFDLYSMKSLVPWDTFTGGVSSALKLNYESHYDKKLGDFKAYNISVGLGYTKQFFNDIFVYSLLNVGIGYGKSEIYAYFYPEIGLLMYEVFDMKTILNYKYIYNQHNSNDGYYDISMEQSIFLDKKMRIGIGIDYKSIYEKDQINYIFSLNYFF